MKNNTLKRAHPDSDNLEQQAGNKRAKTENIPAVVNSTESGFTGSPSQWFDGNKNTQNIKQYALTHTVYCIDAEFRR